MGTYDPLIEAIIPSVLRKYDTPNPSSTKFVFALLALAAVASAAEYGPTLLFEGTLDSLQGAAVDIATAGASLGAKEAQVQGLVDGAQLIYDAEVLLETAVNTDDY